MLLCVKLRRCPRRALSQARAKQCSWRAEGEVKVYGASCQSEEPWSAVAMVTSRLDCCRWVSGWINRKTYFTVMNLPEQTSCAASTLTDSKCKQTDTYCTFTSHCPLRYLDRSPKCFSALKCLNTTQPLLSIMSKHYLFSFTCLQRACCQ